MVYKELFLKQFKKMMLSITLVEKYTYKSQDYLSSLLFPK